MTAPGDPYLGSFQAAVDAGVPFVMVALASYPRIDPRHLAVFSSRTMRTLLRKQMHFGGVIISDDMGAAAAVASLSPAARAIGFLDRRRGHDPLGEPARGRRHGHRGARPR